MCLHTAIYVVYAIRDTYIAYIAHSTHTFSSGAACAQTYAHTQHTQPIQYTHSICTHIAYISYSTHTVSSGAESKRRPATCRFLLLSLLPLLVQNYKYCQNKKDQEQSRKGAAICRFLLLSLLTGGVTCFTSVYVQFSLVLRGGWWVISAIRLVQLVR